jgi:hypothetical protein
MFTHPLVFLYNTLIIFSTMTIALLFKRRRFVWFIVSLFWIVIGTVNGFILLSRMTPFTLYDAKNITDGISIVNTYYTMWQIVLGIIGISLDDSAEAWKQAIKDLKITWTQVSDLLGWKAPIALAFQVNAIPFMAILDSEGTIIQKGLRGEELKEFIKKALE